MHSHFVLKNSSGQYTFQLRAPDSSEVILTSEPYELKAEALAGIAKVRACAGWERRFRRRSRRSGAYFELRAHNGELLGTSALFASASAREAGVAAVREHARRARVEDQT
jgi:uncharacterized protein YegP (UPF0339 family)